MRQTCFAVRYGFFQLCYATAPSPRAPAGQFRSVWLGFSGLEIRTHIPLQAGHPQTAIQLELVGLFPSPEGFVTLSLTASHNNPILNAVELFQDKHRRTHTTIPSLPIPVSMNPPADSSTLQILAKRRGKSEVAYGHSETLNGSLDLSVHTGSETGESDVSEFDLAVRTENGEPEFAKETLHVGEEVAMDESEVTSA